MCALAPSYGRHGSFVRVTYRIQFQDMAHDINSFEPTQMYCFVDDVSAVCMCRQRTRTQESWERERSHVNCMLIERMARQSCQRDGASRRDTLSLLPSRRSCLARSKPLNHVPMESMAKRSYPMRRSQTSGAAVTQTRAATSPQSVLGELVSSFTRCAMERSVLCSHDHGELKMKLWQ